jgi:hypothetical protein
MEGHGWRIAFQALDHWGHIGATNDPIAADNTGHQQSGIPLSSILGGVNGG